MDITGMLFVSTLVMGFTQFYKKITDKDWQGAATIVFAVAVGAVLGFFRTLGLDVITGVMAGLSAAGVVGVAQGVAQKIGVN